MALTFTTFTDPVAGAFTLEVVKGWHVRGGLYHAGLGDRRWCVEMQSPDGLFVMLGDPNCPQCFVHYPMQMEDVMVPSTVGCTFLNIPPSPKRLATYYLKNLAPKRFGTFKISAQRDRPDIAAADIQMTRDKGFPVSNTCKVSVHEVRFQAPSGHVGCLYASTWHEPAWSMGFMTQFEGGVHLWIGPPTLAATAELALNQAKRTFRFTPRAYQIVQQDEAIIASNGVAANLNQQLWFQGQQAAHQTQMAQSNAIVNNYWEQQHVYDRLSQDRSDAMLGRQRLYDESVGKAYEAPAGANFYWRDPQGRIIGTETSDPPDYLGNYTKLRKD